MATTIEQLLAIKCVLGISVTAISKLLNFASAKELFAIWAGEKSASPEQLVLIQWLWDATNIWREQYYSGPDRLYLKMIKEPLSDGRTVFDVLQKQPHLKELKPVFTELQKRIKKNEQRVLKRRNKLGASPCTLDQQKKIQLSLGRVVSFK